MVVVEKCKTIHNCVGTQRHNSTSCSVVQMMGNCEKHSALIEGNFIRKLLFKREKGAALVWLALLAGWNVSALMQLFVCHSEHY